MNEVTRQLEELLSQPPGFGRISLSKGCCQLLPQLFYGFGSGNSLRMSFSQMIPIFRRNTADRPC